VSRRYGGKQAKNTQRTEAKCLEITFLADWRPGWRKSAVIQTLHKSYDFIKNIVFIKEGDFLNHLERLFQLTRSAIFSFVFSVRDKALNEKEDGRIYLPNSILRKDYR
ncbi:MAG: hypothetical protein V7751_11515, partial [Pseudoalteromonas distincta]